MDLFLYQKLLRAAWRNFASRRESFDEPQPQPQPEEPEGFSDSREGRHYRDGRRHDGGRHDGGRRHNRHDNNRNDTSGFFSGISLLFAVLYMVSFVLLGGLAAYLSWTSNTLVGWHPGFKVIFAFFALLSWFTYLGTYLISRLDMVWFIQRNCGLSAMPQDMPPMPQPEQYAMPRDAPAPFVPASRDRDA